MFAVHYTTARPGSFAPMCEKKVSDIQGQSSIAQCPTSGFGILHRKILSFFSWNPEGASLELVSEELNHLAAILHVYAGSLIFMK